MTKIPNPINIGFRMLRRDPAIYLVEVLWRWSSAIISLCIFVAAGFILISPLSVGDTLSSTWKTHDAQRMGVLLLTILLMLGKKAVIAAVAVPVIIAFLWSFLAALGRRITLQRLRHSVGPLSFSTMLALQLLRAFITWFSAILLLSSLGGEAYLATRGPKPNLFLYYELVIPSVLLICIFWLVANWYFSLATIFGRQGQGLFRAFRHARETVWLQRADFAATSFLFLLLRVVLLLFVVAICGLISSLMGSSPQLYFGLVVAAALGYFVTADFLYMARMASYLALAEAHVEAAIDRLVRLSSEPA